MENHPIPQDVTGFKFRLIGSMTLKQFLYVLAGGILACVAYILPFSIGIRIPLVLFFGGIGAALAFIPIEGRPMDVMMVNFLKALPAENQFVYRKKGAEALIALYFSAQHIAKEEAQLHDENQEEIARKRELLKNTLKLSSSYRPDINELSTLSNVSTYFADQTSAPTPSQTATIAPPPSDQLEKEEKKETPKELKVATPPPAIDKSLDSNINEDVPRPIPSPTPISADSVPPLQVEVQEETDKKELEEEKRIDQILEKESSAKPPETRAKVIPNVIIVKKKVPETPVSKEAVREVVTTSPTNVTVQNTLQPTIQPHVVSGTETVVAEAENVVTVPEKVVAGTEKIVAGDAEKIVKTAPGNEKPPEIIQIIQTTKAQPRDNSDEELKIALQEIQQIKTSPAPTIEPIKKVEESVVPATAEAAPETIQPKVDMVEKRAEISPPPANILQKEELKPLAEAATQSPKPEEQSTPIAAIPQEQVYVPETTYSLQPIQKTYETVVPNESSHVKSIATADQLKAGFPQLPDIPNIVLGIVKDPRGKVLQNILVEIINSQGTPIRAFKTNALGQFTAATPLQDGEYNVVLEDARKVNEFENIHLSLDGRIFQPLEIFSVDDREKLRRELFGGTQGLQAAQAI